MQLVLQVTSQQAAAMGPAASKVFDEAGGTIGRLQGSDWVLPDKERIVSGLHLIVRYIGGAFSLEDVSTNGTYLNGSKESIGKKNEPAMLKSGDRIAIGDYEIYVNIIETDAVPDEIKARTEVPAAIAPVAAGATEPSGQPSVATPIPANVTDPPGLGPVDPLDLIGGAPAPKTPPPAPGAMPDHAPAQSAAFTPPNPSPNPANNPAMNQTPTPPPTPAAASGTQPAAGMIPDDWTINPVSSKAATPPPAVDTASATAPGAAAPVAGSSATAPVSASIYAELMPLIVQGVMDVLKSRNDIKNEFRLNVTTINTVGNNPLKFSPSVEAAIAQLFQDPQPGYLGARDAFEQGFDDIRAHQLAMMAGMRAAFDHLLQQFSPEALEDYFESGGKRGGFFGKGSKGQYWELYCDFYARTTRDSDDNFRKLFGEEFAVAYETQMERLTKK